MKKVLLMSAAALLLVGCGGNEENSDSSEMENQASESSSEMVEETQGEYYFDGTDLVTEDFKITITDYKVLQPGEGNNYGETPLIGFWFDTTVSEDVTDREIDPNNAWILSFEAVQDNDPNIVNQLNVGMLPDDAHLDSQMQTIKPGGTASSSVSYELTDLETPVTLTAIGDMLTGEELGSHDFSLQ